MKAKWIIAGLGILTAGGYFIHDSKKRPTIRFVGYGPPPFPADWPGELPKFEIRNDTRHSFAFFSEARIERVLDSIGTREIKAMACIPKTETLAPGKSVQFAVTLHHPMKAGEKFAIGYRFYPASAISSTGSPSFLREALDWCRDRLAQGRDEEPITWSDYVDFKP